MHFDFHFTAVSVLWTLTFAALLVLLVVLMGRDRARRFPWFTASIALVALRLLTNRLLHDKLPQLTMGAIAITLADISVLVALIVLVEMARRAFKKAGAAAWAGWTVGLLALGGVVLWKWGPWPPLKGLAFDTLIAKLQFMQLIAVKAGLLVDVLSVALGFLVVAFGQRYGAGWRSHVQRIMIGLSTASIAQMGAQGIWEIIARHTTPHSREEYEHVIGLQEKLLNTNSAVYVIVLIWWIVCLWIDEPGAVASADTTAPVREYLDADKASESPES
ncbi:MAG: hypothetical protein WA354_06665 [Terracidiphilus sp.]